MTQPETKDPLVALSHALSALDLDCKDAFCLFGGPGGARAGMPTNSGCKCLPAHPEVRHALAAVLRAAKRVASAGLLNPENTAPGKIFASDGRPPAPRLADCTPARVLLAVREALDGLEVVDGEVRCRRPAQR